MFSVTSGVVRTTTGRNIQFIKVETGMDPVTASSSRIKSVLCGNLAETPAGDRWMIEYLCKLLQERGQAYYDGVEDHEHLNVLIDSLCTN